MKSIDDIIQHYTKEDKPMNPEKLADFKEMANVQRYENSHRRILVDARIRQVDPSYRVSQDEEKEEAE